MKFFTNNQLGLIIAGSLCLTPQTDAFASKELLDFSGGELPSIVSAYQPEHHSYLFENTVQQAVVFQRDGTEAVIATMKIAPTNRDNLPKGLSSLPGRLTPVFQDLERGIMPHPRPTLEEEKLLTAFEAIRESKIPFASLSKEQQEQCLEGLQLKIDLEQRADKHLKALWNMVVHPEEDKTYSLSYDVASCVMEKAWVVTFDLSCIAPNVEPSAKKPRLSPGAGHEVNPLDLGKFTSFEEIMTRIQNTFVPGIQQFVEGLNRQNESGGHNRQMFN